MLAITFRDSGRYTENWELPQSRFEESCSSRHVVTNGVLIRPYWGGVSLSETTAPVENPVCKFHDRIMLEGFSPDICFF
jgi:hypothetical protein